MNPKGLVAWLNGSVTYWLTTNKLLSRLLRKSTIEENLIKILMSTRNKKCNR